MIHIRLVGGPNDGQELELSDGYEDMQYLRVLVPRETDVYAPFFSKEVRFYDKSLSVMRKEDDDPAVAFLSTRTAAYLKSGIDDDGTRVYRFS